MNLVFESLNEFERGIEPKASMNTGIISKMREDLEKLGYTPDKYEILPNLTIKMKQMNYGMTDTIKLIELKYTHPKWFTFVDKIKHEDKKSTRQLIDVKKAIDKALQDGISKEDIKTLLKQWAEKQISNEGTLYLNKKTRDKKDIEEDDENNVYIFIGFKDKVPVKGTKYFEEKLNTESIIKIDPFDMQSHQAIAMLKIRARIQYPDGNVYAVRIPKFLMDKDRYESIPDHVYDIFVKYKIKITN